MKCSRNVIAILISGLVACKPQPNASDISRSPLTAPSVPANNLPSDAEIAAALMQHHAGSCEQAQIYQRSNTPWMSHAAPLEQVVKEREAILHLLESSKNVSFEKQVVTSTLSATGEPVAYSRIYAVGSDAYPNVRDSIEIYIGKEISAEGHPMGGAYRISICPFVPRAIRIIDHDVDKTSDKTVIIRYRETFGPSNGAGLLGVMYGINPELAPTLMNTFGVPPQRSGLATMHRTDADGWMIEADRYR